MPHITDDELELTGIEQAYLNIRNGHWDLTTFQRYLFLIAIVFSDNMVRVDTKDF